MGDYDLDAAVAAAQVGDEWAVTLLYRALQPQLVHYLRHHAGDAAEDIASETWLSAARNLAAFRGNAADFRAWLFTIGRRRLADHHRLSARRPRVVGLDDNNEEPAVEDSGEIVARALTTREAIAALVRNLPPDQAEVILLRVVADLSVEQVAEVLERSAGAVRALQHRAVRKLAKTWERPGVTL